MKEGEPDEAGEPVAEVAAPAEGGAGEVSPEGIPAPIGLNIFTALSSFKMVS